MSRFVETYTELGPINPAPAFLCEGCGGLVGDRTRHDIFHRALRLTSGFNSGYRRSVAWLKIRAERAS